MTTNPKLLVVDDEPQLLSLVSYALSTGGFEVATATSGAEALAYTSENPVDLIVLDVVLPDGSGIDFCRRLKRHSQAPVIFLTVMSDQVDVISGLEAGADDYLAKPFSVEELILRVNAVLRRSTPPDDEIRVGDLTLRLHSYEAALAGVAMAVTPLEFRFLRYLAINSARVVPPSELVEEVWGLADLGGHDPIIKTVVYRIRQKMKETSSSNSVTIRNLRGVGYRLSAGS